MEGRVGSPPRQDSRRCIRQGLVDGAPALAEAGAVGPPLFGLEGSHTRVSTVFLGDLALGRHSMIGDIQVT